MEKIPEPMDREREIIRIMLDTLTGGETPGQPYFSSDAERFRFAEKELLFTTDEFSEEDLFRDHDLTVLGWNLAVATISDIYAAGGTPLFFGHSVSVPPSWTNLQIRDLSKGIDSCLKQSGLTFIGGDLGFSERWHYTGIVIGEVKKPLTRLGARAGDSIYITGSIGKGNLEAALKLYSKNPALKHLLNRFPVRFPSRKSESEVIRNVAGCCIDTSDGVLKALQTIAELNSVGFIAGNLPYSPEGLLATRLLGKPHELLFLGESGEYELLFTVLPEKEPLLLMEARKKDLVFHKIGTITTSPDLILKEKTREIDLQKFRFSARDYPDVGSYLDKLVKTLGDESDE
jgi:thiamine-monophosphate kinase